MNPLRKEILATGMIFPIITHYFSRDHLRVSIDLRSLSRPEVRFPTSVTIFLQSNQFYVQGKSQIKSQKRPLIKMASATVTSSSCFQGGGVCLARANSNLGPYHCPSVFADSRRLNQMAADVNRGSKFYCFRT